MAHPLVEAARTLSGTLLAPAAATVDVATVPSSHLDALAAAGLFGAAAQGVPPLVQYEVGELLAAGCGPTWFVWAQHPLALVGASDNRVLRRRLLDDLCTGRRRGGIAVAHLRRRPSPVTATRVDGGWRVDGHVPWITGWGLIDVVALGAVTADGDVIMAAVPAEPGPRLVVSPPLRLAAMGAAATVTADCDGLFVRDVDVIIRLPIEIWRCQDAARAANAVPAVFGIASAAVAALARTPDALPLANGLSEAIDRCRGAVHRLMEHTAAESPWTNGWPFEPRLCIWVSVPPQHWLPPWGAGRCPSNSPLNAGREKCCSSSSRRKLRRAGRQCSSSSGRSVMQDGPSGDRRLRVFGS